MVHKGTPAKKITIIMILLLLAATFAHGQQEKITVTLWDYKVAQSSYLENEIKLFQEKYPYIEIQRIRQVQKKYKDLVLFAARSENLPDLYFPWKTDINDDVAQKWCMPLDKWATPEWKKRFPKGSFAEGVHTMKGKTYLIPFEQPYVWHQVYINRKVFRDAGLVDKSGNVLHPKTWDQFRKFAKTITQSGKGKGKGKGKVFGLGIALQNPPGLFPHMFLEWARGAGAAGGDFSERFEMDFRVGKYNLDHPAYVKLMKFLLSMKKDGSIVPNYMSLDDETLKVRFADGEIGMILGGIWNQTGWQTTHPGWQDYDCIAAPAPDEKGYQCLQCVSPEVQQSTYFMAKNCKHPDEAWLFLDWLATPEAGARFVRSGNGQSVFPSANSRENARTEQFAQFLDICRTYLRWSPNPAARNPNLSMVKWATGEELMPSRTGIFAGIMSGQIPEKDIAKSFKKLNDAYNKALEESMREVKDKGYEVDLKDLVFTDWNPKESYGS